MVCMDVLHSYLGGEIGRSFRLAIYLHLVTGINHVCTCHVVSWFFFPDTRNFSSIVTLDIFTLP